ncbi:MAG: cytochrome c maturation protein CcmE [Pseudomonadota bacterium]
MSLAGARKKKRIRLIAFGAAALTAATVLAGFAFNDAIVFFHPPVELIAKAEAGEIQPERRIRLGGLVAAGSVEDAADGSVHFTVTDNEAAVPVRFEGVLPSLFREGQGVVAEGYYRAGRFEAAEVLAKHDENYMPKEVADALKETGQWKPGEPAPAPAALSY